jgi:hypothetical protein
VLHADRVHILAGGLIRAVGGPELAQELEVSGYAAFAPDGELDPEPVPVMPHLDDPFGDPLGAP